MPMTTETGTPNQNPMRQPSWLRLLSGWSVYVERPVLLFVLLGFSSGLPLALTGQTLQVWMKEEGISLAAIGLFALVGSPYVFKYLWAPVFDAFHIPWLHRALGRRRSWLLVTQLGLMLAISAMGLVNPVATPWLMAGAAVLVAFLSASQDIVIDAFRIESLEERQFGAGIANYVAAYRVAMLTSTLGAFMLADWLQQSGTPGNMVWALTYGAMASFMLLGIGATFLAKEPERIASDKDETAHWTKRLTQAVIDPFRDFMTREYWLAILLFVMLFKFGDAFAGIMTAPFVLDIGFDKVTYGWAVKVVGLGAVLTGGILGGYTVNRWPMLTNLWVAGVLQMLSNLVFCWQAVMGAQTWALVVTISVENFTGGLGTIIFVAYISSLCRDQAFTATQFALLSALTAVGRTILSSTSGFVVEAVDWTVFFLLTTAAAIPGLILLAWLAHRGAISRDTAAAQPQSA